MSEASQGEEMAGCVPGMSADSPTARLHPSSQIMTWASNGIQDESESAPGVQLAWAGSRDCSPSSPDTVHNPVLQGLSVFTARLPQSQFCSGGSVAATTHVTATLPHHSSVFLRYCVF